MCRCGACEPGLELAGGAKKIDLCLGGFEIGIEESDELFALRDTGILFVFWAHLRASEVSAAGLQLYDKDVEVLPGELLIESGDIGASGEFSGGVAGAKARVEELIANHVGLVEGVGGVGC